MSFVPKRITIAETACDFEREPMTRPFGFKGGYLTEEWIVSALVRSTSGSHGIGLGTQSVLWSDASVFAANSEAGGNAVMFSLTQFALNLIRGRTFVSPVELNDWLWPHAPAAAPESHAESAESAEAAAPSVESSSTSIPDSLPEQASESPAESAPGE